MCAFAHPFREGMPEGSIFPLLVIEIGPWTWIEVGGATEVYSLAGVKISLGVTEPPSDICYFIIPEVAGSVAMAIVLQL